MLLLILSSVILPDCKMLLWLKQISSQTWFDRDLIRCKSGEPRFALWLYFDSTRPIYFCTKMNDRSRAVEERRSYLAEIEFAFLTQRTASKMRRFLTFLWHRFINSLAATLHRLVKWHDPRKLHSLLVCAKLIKQVPSFSPSPFLSLSLFFPLFVVYAHWNVLNSDSQRPHRLQVRLLLAHFSA